MRVCDTVKCSAFPCPGVNHGCYVVPDIEVKPRKVRIVLVSEAAPANIGDYYYAKGDPLFQQTTVQAFKDAGASVESIKDILALGVYLTTAVKCGKTGYNVASSVIAECSVLLEQELALFADAVAYLLMGDVAIRALNAIATRNGKARVIPAVSTYKIRGQDYAYDGKRVFPSYLQAGPSFFIEKSKRRMIADDIGRALELLS